MSTTPSAGLVECGNCHAAVRPRPYCSVCGDPLDARERARRAFAADPDEGAWAVRVVSTFFPQLPRADMDAFRLALLVGVATVVVLVALGYLAVALVVSAVLVPLLLAIYVYSVDVYEDEPIRVVLVTLAWGVISGALYGLALRVLFPAQIGPPSDDPVTVVARLVVLPAAAMALMVAGPLLLLRFRKFNDVLDGATFGAVSGATFVGAQIVVQSIDLIGAGPQPGGDTWSWVLRIVEFGVAIPLIAGGAAAGACGAFWLRYRAPVRDRDALGPLGNPAMAMGLAVVVLILANGALLELRDLPRLAALAILAAGAVLWLRQLLDLGLRQEAIEAATSEPVTCTNCGRGSSEGSFCSECGVALRALPKRPHLADAEGTEPRHVAASRLAGNRSLGAYLVGLATAVTIGTAAVILLAPTTTPPCPDPTAPCAAAVARADAGQLVAPAQRVDAPIRFGQTSMSDLGWQFDWDPRYFSIDESEPSGAIWLETRWVAPTVSGARAEIAISIRIEVVPATESTPDAMLEDLLALTDDLLESAEPRDEHGTRLLRPHIGFRPAGARYLVGDFGAQGALTPFGAHLLSASDGRLTAGIAMFLAQPDEAFPFHSGSVRTTRFVGDLLDDIVKRFYWTEAGP